MCLLYFFNIKALDACQIVSSLVFAGGYSVLGWNHPGFGGSTVSQHHAICSWHNGTQLMTQVMLYLHVFYLKCQMDGNLCVPVFLLYFFREFHFLKTRPMRWTSLVQFAVHKLGFQLSDIIVYAWSIGGFTGKQSHTSKSANH